MIIADIMTPKPVSVYMDTELALIKEIFDNAKFHHLLVEDENDHSLVGIISDRDLLNAISPYLNTRSETKRDTATLNQRAHQIMSRKPITVSPTCDINTAARKLLDENISCLPVIETNQKIVGIVSWKDLLRKLT